jgi:dTDP-4-amino-4,6-dideoxygalactose transaminase
MKIPALDMKAQLAPIRREIDQAIARVLDHGGFVLGKEVEKFEKDICLYSGSKYSIGVSNGTDAIVLALEALGIKRGDRVLCPAFTYFATVGAVASIGAIPVFIDIDPQTYCIDPESIKSYLHQTPKAIIPVHIYGQCADMDSILAAADKFNLKVIEDTAQAFGAVYKNKKAGLPVRQAGTMGDCGTVSFFPGKNLGACGDAGMVLARDESVADILRQLRNQGTAVSDKYKHIYPGHNNRLDSIQAAILVVKLKYMDTWNRKRAENAAYYNGQLAALELITPYVPDTNTHIYHQYMVRAKNNESRDHIMNHLKEKGIDSRVFYPIPLHLQPCFSYLGYKRGDFPESEKAAEEIFSLPVYPELTKSEMDYVVDSVKEGLRIKY